MQGVGVSGRVHFLLIPHTHWDREWYLSFEVFRHRLVRLLDKLMDTMESDPAYRLFHLDGQTIPLEDYEQIKGPSERLRRLVRDNRLRIGPWYILPDEFLVSGECLIRNLERGLGICREYGVDPVRVGYLPDMFGHIQEMPQILAGFGLNRALMWRGITSDVTEREFIWEAPDGSQVFTVFLPLGYGPAAGLPQNTELLIERLKDLVTVLGSEDYRNDGGDKVVVLLNGTDHAEAQTHLPQALDAVTRIKPEWSWEFGDIETWIASLAKKGAPQVVHQGELRCADRTLILPSVASARLYLKKLDFTASAGLTRYAEPLCALGLSLGGPDCAGFLDYAWKLLLQNHPHDSICGCSIDEVHDEMEVRYKKALDVSERIISENMDLVIKELDIGGPGVVVFNPGGNQSPGLLIGEIEGKVKPGTALAGDGEYPLQVLERVEPESILMDVNLPRKAAAVLLGTMAADELFGLYLHQWKIKIKDDRMEVRLDAGSSPAGADADALKNEIEEALAVPGIKKIRIKVYKLAQHRAAAMVPELPGYCARAYPLIKGSGPRGPEVEVGHESMENERVRVQFEPGGTCLLLDKASGIGYRCLRFLDVGDRGDTYNFDPVPGDEVICEPEKVALKALTTGPVAALMKIRHRFRIPEGLHKNRKARSKKMVGLDLTTRITLYRDLARVDFSTTFENPARDHRLQVAVRAPYETESIRVESGFSTVERPLQETRPPDRSGPADLATLLLGREGTYSTSAQRTLSMISNGEHGLAVFNKGMAEVDAVGLDGATRIAMTMVRSVGWLSRGDLGLRRGNAGPSVATPGAQCPRTFTWEYALMPFCGHEAEGPMVAAAHAFAFPPLFFPVDGRGSGKAGALGFIGIDNPAVYASAVRPLGQGGLEIRLVNASLQGQECKLSWGPWWKDPRPVDFTGKAVSCPGFEAEASKAIVRFRPGQIVTLHLSKK